MLVIRIDDDGHGSDGQCYRYKALVHVINVMAMVMDLVIVLKM